MALRNCTLLTLQFTTCTVPVYSSALLGYRLSPEKEHKRSPLKENDTWSHLPRLVYHHHLLLARTTLPRLQVLLFFLPLLFRTILHTLALGRNFWGHQVVNWEGTPTSPSSCLIYQMVLFISAHPPRMLAKKNGGHLPRPAIKTLNCVPNSDSSGNQNMRRNKIKNNQFCSQIITRVTGNSFFPHGSRSFLSLSSAVTIRCTLRLWTKAWLGLSSWRWPPGIALQVLRYCLPRPPCGILWLF